MCVNVYVCACSSMRKMFIISILVYSSSSSLLLSSSLPQDRGPVRLVFAVSLKGTQKVVNIRSGLVLHNTLQLPLEVKLDPPSGAKGLVCTYMYMYRGHYFPYAQLTTMMLITLDHTIVIIVNVQHGLSAVLCYVLGATHPNTDNAMSCDVQCCIPNSIPILFLYLLCASFFFFVLLSLSLQFFSSPLH